MNHQTMDDFGDTNPEGKFGDSRSHKFNDFEILETDEEDVDLWP